MLPLIFHTDTVASTVFPPNWHENAELLLCLSGEGYVKCDTETYPFTPGTLAVINSGVLHSIHSESQVVYHCLIIGNSFCKENGLDMTQIRLQESVASEAVNALYNEAVEAIRIANQQPRPYSIPRVRAALLQLLVELCRHHSAVEQTAEEDTAVSVERVKQVVLYIKNHLSEKLTLEGIARQVGVSKYHLSREFKSLTGHTLFDMIHIIRCKEAKRLIVNGAAVSEAAIACGFENASYFSRCFKQHYGTLPSKYKK